MKELKDILTEALKINSKSKVNTYNYHPKSRGELLNLIEELIKERGLDADLNDVDTSKITDMSYLFTFKRANFNGNISNWNVSNVKDMTWMFMDSKFNGDISNWDVSKVKDMTWMFMDSKFNGDISNWDVSKVKTMNDIFNNCPLEKNPPKWYKE